MKKKTYIFYVYFSIIMKYHVIGEEFIGIYHRYLGRVDVPLFMMTDEEFEMFLRMISNIW